MAAVRRICSKICNPSSCDLAIIPSSNPTLYGTGTYWVLTSEPLSEIIALYFWVAGVFLVHSLFAMEPTSAWALMMEDDE